MKIYHNRQYIVKINGSLCKKEMSLYPKHKVDHHIDDALGNSLSVLDYYSSVL